jgi:hypothetical protein
MLPVFKFLNLWSPFKIPFYIVPPIVFSFRAKAFFYLETIRRFSWNGNPVSHWRLHDNRRMNTSTDVSKFHHFRVKCWILLKPVLGGLDGNLHFPVPSMNRLNQTETATLSLGILFFLYLISTFSIWSKWHTPLLLKLCFVKLNLCKTACNSVSNLQYDIDLDVSCVNVSVVARSISADNFFIIPRI